MPACPPTCPKVRQQIRKALEDGEITPPFGEPRDVTSVTRIRDNTGYLQHERDPNDPAQPSPTSIHEPEHSTQISDYETATSVTPTTQTALTYPRNPSRNSKEDISHNGKPLSSYSGTKKFPRKDVPTAVAGPSRAPYCAREARLQKASDGRSRESYEKIRALEVIKEKRRRRLAEQQRVADRYFLTKGFNYFDDVCTCTLSCIVRSLRNDSFVRSLLASTALFALGIKLCCELNHWYIPARM